MFLVIMKYIILVFNHLLFMKETDNMVMNLIIDQKLLRDDDSKNKSIEELKQVIKPIPEEIVKAIDDAIQFYKNQNPQNNNPTIIDLYNSLVEQIEGWLTTKQIENAKKRNIYNTQEYIQNDASFHESIIESWYWPLLTDKVIEEISKFITLEEIEFVDWSKSIIINWKKITYPRYGEFTQDDFIDENWQLSPQWVSKINEQWNYINEKYKKFVENTWSTQQSSEYLYEVINEVAQQFKKIWIDLPQDIWRDFLKSNRQRSILLLETFRALTGIKGRFHIDADNWKNHIYFLDDECWAMFNSFEKNRNFSFIWN